MTNPVMLLCRAWDMDLKIPVNFPYRQLIYCIQQGAELPNSHHYRQLNGGSLDKMFPPSVHLITESITLKDVLHR